MLRAARLLTVLLGAAVALGGCSDPKPVPVLNRTIGLKLDEYRILPKVVEAPAGPLRLVIRNIGILTHNVAVEKIPKVGSDKPGEVLARTTTVHAGERSPVVELNLPPGTYRLVCTIGNHDDLGQTGTLIVK
jgi:plastocyanin